MPRKKSSKRPPCPDPGNYDWVHCKEGGYWRRKRQSSAVNSVLQENNGHLKKVSPLNKAIRQILQPYLKDMAPGRLGNRMNGLMMRGRKSTGKTNVGYLTGMDFQQMHTVDKIIARTHIVTERDVANGTFTLTVPRLHRFVQEWPNPKVTDYRIGLIMVYGRRGKKHELLVDHEYSDKLPCDSEGDAIHLQLPLSNKLGFWMACLQLECFEGRFGVSGNKHRRMVVLRAEGVVG
jgi:hypothetical protein